MLKLNQTLKGLSLALFVSLFAVGCGDSIRSGSSAFDINGVDLSQDTIALDVTLTQGAQPTINTSSPVQFSNIKVIRFIGIDARTGDRVLLGISSEQDNVNMQGSAHPITDITSLQANDRVWLKDSKIETDFVGWVGFGPEPQVTISVNLTSQSILDLPQPTQNVASQSAIKIYVHFERK